MKSAANEMGGGLGQEAVNANMPGWIVAESH